MINRFKSFLKTYWPYLLIFLLSLSTALPLFHGGYFSHQDDLQVMRIFEMRKCLIDLQIPCRWVPDMGFGNGYPLFNYYGVPPYYLGAVLSFAFGYIGAAKILFIIPLLLGGFAMYLLGKELFGKIAGLAAAVLFVLVPYRSVDIYVRGDVTESFAIALAPLIFYLYLKLIRNPSIKNLVGATVVFGLFLITHNVMSLFFVPVLFLWILYWLVVGKLKNLKVILISLALGIGLSAFFVLPAFFEKDLVQVESLKTLTFDFRANYVTLNQLFLSRFWGYGASVWGPDDGMSFQVGWPHWWLAFISVPVTLVLFFRKNKRNLATLLSFLLIVFLFSVFMTHNRSTFIWEKISIIQFAQFPWRFLSLSIFAVSLIGGALVSLLNPKTKVMAFVAISVLAIALNLPYFKVDKYYQITDQQKLSGYEFTKQQYAGILDYLPKTAVEPNEAAPKSPVVVTGEAKISNFDNKSNRFVFQANVSKTANIEVPIFDFPVWKVKVNGQSILHSHQNFLGRIRLDLPKGEYRVEGLFTNTPIRSFANLVTVFSTGVLIILVALPKRVKKGKMNLK